MSLLRNVPDDCLLDTVGAPSAGGCKRLVLMLHGLKGQPSDFRAVVKAMKAGGGDGHGGDLIVRPRVTDNTTQGIEVPARQVHAIVKSVVEACPSLEACSIVCLSFGGLYGRFLAKLMVEDGLLGAHDDHAAALQARVFLTIASPHLGIRRFATTGLRGCFDAAWNTWAPRVVGVSGEEMLLEDKQQLLHQMAGGEYLGALRAFERRVCYANSQHDPQVPAWTGCIERLAPSGYDSWPCLTDYPSLLDPPAATGANADCREPSFPIYALDAKAKELDDMQQQLHGLGWQKHWARLPALPNAHNQIIGLMPGERGKDVPRHIALQLI